MLNKSLAIRDIKPNDREIFLNLCGRFYQLPAVNHPVPPDHFARTFDAALAQNPLVRLLMLEWEGETAGYFQIVFSYSSEAGGEVVWLEELYILPAFQSKGLGRAVLAWVEQEYADAARFRLEVSSDNARAAKLYESLGYSVLPYIQMIKEK
ncbi:GNAT family N-acetyltransferase [Oscillospiraceae bacterium MB08-C2-2]|nr:GNAT family N-acetyltransferase [Oscillospiraceae bacterium MB08-C2-2]